MSRINIEKKKEFVKRVSDEIAKVKGVWFTDFTGLVVIEMVNLRRKLKENEIKYQVIKKRLLKRILEERGISIEDEWFKGGCGICLGNDLIVAAKVLDELVKLYPKFKIKGGWFEGRNFKEKEITEIAKLPSKEELIVKFITNLNYPIYGLVSCFKNLLTNLVYVLSEVRRIKEERSKNEQKG
jgi:large subunit ribosomal protein L10